MQYNRTNSRESMEKQTIYCLVGPCQQSSPYYVFFVSSNNNDLEDVFIKILSERTIYTWSYILLDIIYWNENA